PERGRGGRAHWRAEDPGRHDAVRAEDRARRGGRGRPAQRVGGRGAEPASGGLPGTVTPGWLIVTISITRIVLAWLSILISLRMMTGRRCRLVPRRPVPCCLVRRRRLRAPPRCSGPPWTRPVPMPACWLPAGSNGA